MYIVPIISISLKNPGLSQYWLFLERNGTHLIPIEATEAADAIAYAKDFYSAHALTQAAEPFCVGDLVFAPVDASTQDLASFYSWKEVAPGTTPPKEAWRTFMWFSTPDMSDPWGVNRMMDTIAVADATKHTVFSVLSAFISGSADSSTLRTSA
jgi:hypothetical protein